MCRYRFGMSVAGGEFSIVLRRHRPVKLLKETTYT